MASWKFSSGVASAPIQRITSFEFSFEPPSSYFITLSGGPCIFLSKEARQLCSLGICSESELSKRGCWPEQPVSQISNSFSHHQQGRVDFNTVNPSLPTRNIVGFRKQNSILGDKLRLCCGNSGTPPSPTPVYSFLPKKETSLCVQIDQTWCRKHCRLSICTESETSRFVSRVWWLLYISLKRGC